MPQHHSGDADARHTVLRDVKSRCTDTMMRVGVLIFSSATLLRCGLHMLAFDLAYSARMNILTAGGFARPPWWISGHRRPDIVQCPLKPWCGSGCTMSCPLARSALQAVRRCLANTLIWMAPVCSSWVWVNRGTSLRNAAVPLGDPNNCGVKQGNEMVAKRLACPFRGAVALCNEGLREMPCKAFAGCPMRWRFGEACVPHPIHYAEAVLLGGGAAGVQLARASPSISSSAGLWQGP